MARVDADNTACYDLFNPLFMMLFLFLATLYKAIL